MRKKKADYHPAIVPATIEHGCTKHYMLKNGRVSVCLIMAKCGKKPIARGITVHNKDEDLYNKTEGFKQATRHAVRGLLGRKQGLAVVNPKAKKALEGTGFTQKAYKNPKLTEVERRLVAFI